MSTGVGRRILTRLLMPAGADETTFPLLAARALRAFGDGYVAVLLPAYLLALGFDQLDVGFLSTATLAGSALAMLTLGAIGYRWTTRRLLLSAAFLMAITGLGFASVSSFWPLFVIAFVGTLSPGSGDVSVFLPLEHARLAQAASGNARTILFARYSLIGSLSAAAGALAAGIPAWLVPWSGLSLIDGLRAMFVLYGLLGGSVWLLYRTLPAFEIHPAPLPQPLGPSRSIVFKLAMLFSIDAFAGGLLGNSLLTLWLFERFGLSLGQAGTFFFCAGLLSAGSQLAAPVVARRIGLLNTMVFTHIPANVCLIFAAIAPNLEAALALLFLRSALSQMDVPTRTAYVMAVVTPAERTAAASFTAVSRSLASIASPTFTGALLASGLLSAPLIACGALKIAYDMALLIFFRRLNVPRDRE
ncbi:MFS transporter [Nitrosovibrio sp. Nv6]|uniref:MFS transporter n=1 Tax=Nitrosovibrio sp. Nv6 TaxID=1855340 RepID=UPI0008BCF195|nr:MFS transporter [Nitrosovibrio sp. Nv6]SEP36944.1 Predicted arabinose efflux permease, MFS family [Nitrosovibrio sp. Nv6]